MTLDYQLIGLLAMGAVQLISLVGAYYGLKGDNAKLASEFHLAMANEKSDRLAVVAAAKAELITSINRVETYVNDLTHRVTTLESGQDEWTKSLRQRTHDLANDVHKLIVKVALLEKGHEAKP